MEKVIYKLYFQDVSNFIWRKLRIQTKARIVGLFLAKFHGSNLSSYEVVNLASHYFNNKKSKFYNACFHLVESILLDKQLDYQSIILEDLHYLDTAELMRIADSFGRFDIGYSLRVKYCHNLEKNAVKDRSNRRDRLFYYLHKQLYGDDLFLYTNQEIKIKVPIYLRQFHARMISTFNNKKMTSLIDIHFYNRVHKKNIAILAPGILHFDEKLIDELKEFDEIIPITYMNEQYSELPYPIKISYYNEERSKRLINDKSFREGINLDIYCVKTTGNYYPNFREIIKDCHKWFLGSPNMVQVAVYDLLCQQPARIKVFGMNFFLSKHSYNPVYQSSLSKYSLDSKTSSYSLSIHNILSNYMYIKNLYSNGLIELDQNATTLILEGERNYCHKMTILYQK
jgi:hypothetical protein